MADWSSLPSELVRHIADCLLFTNDLDCYIDFRAVCPKWRSATDDPKNSSELRFRPHRWIIIDEVFENDARLMVNTDSGRVVRRDLPLLQSYHVVATTHGGFFILAIKEPPHAAVVLNPFTGHTIRYKAPVPPCVDVSAAALSGHSSGKLSLNSFLSERQEHGEVISGECTRKSFLSSVASVRMNSSPTLILLWDACYEQYMAYPDSDSFAVELDDELLDYLLDSDLYTAELAGEYIGPFTFMRLAVTGGICATDRWEYSLGPLPGASADKIYRLMKLFVIDHDKMFYKNPATKFADLPGTGDVNHLFLVESAGELLAIIKLPQDLKVFRLDSGDKLEEPVKSIGGGRAIFVGYRRCFSVSTDKIPSVVANCVYYVKSKDSSLDICKYDLENETEQIVSKAIDSLNPVTLSSASPPFTIVQLLSSYTINAGESQLAKETRKQQLLERERLKQEDPEGYRAFRLFGA
ncbi:unnamed protein product [Alopecurus aequalis]